MRHFAHIGINLLSSDYLLCLKTLFRSVGPPGVPGGATPGKVVMGLRIIKCNQVNFPIDLQFAWNSIDDIMFTR